MFIVEIMFARVRQLLDAGKPLVPDQIRELNELEIRSEDCGDICSKVFDLVRDKLHDFQGPFDACHIGRLVKLLKPLSPKEAKKTIIFLLVGVLKRAFPAFMHRQFYRLVLHGCAAAPWYFDVDGTLAFFREIEDDCSLDRLASLASTRDPRAFLVVHKMVQKHGISSVFTVLDSELKKLGSNTALAALSLVTTGDLESRQRSVRFLADALFFVGDGVDKLLPILKPRWIEARSKLALSQVKETHVVYLPTKTEEDQQACFFRPYYEACNMDPGLWDQFAKRQFVTLSDGSMLTKSGDLLSGPFESGDFALARAFHRSVSLATLRLPCSDATIFRSKDGKMFVHTRPDPKLRLGKVDDLAWRLASVLLRMEPRDPRGHAITGPLLPFSGLSDLVNRNYKDPDYTSFWFPFWNRCKEAMPELRVTLDKLISMGPPKELAL